MDDTPIRPVKQLSFWIDWAVLAAFTAAFLLRGNSEFLLYAVTLAVLIAVVQRTHRTYDYPALARWGFAAWLVLHMCGGYINNALDICFNGVGGLAALPLVRRK